MERRTMVTESQQCVDFGGKLVIKSCHNYITERLYEVEGEKKERLVDTCRWKKKG